MLATFTTDPEIILLGRETIYRNGKRVGYLSSAGYGHTIGKSIGMGYLRDSQGVDQDFILSGKYELEVATELMPCKVHLTPLVDPRMRRIKC